jgi:DNA primase
MGIDDEDVRRVRDSSDIVAVISEHLALKRVGRRFTGLCPFHAEKTPSFSVNAEEGLYYCFGCGAKGDVITFVREIEHLDFVGAVERLAAKSGITLRYTTRNEGEGRKKRSRLIEAMGAAVDWYHQRLLEAPDAAPARSYLRMRGFDGELVRRYRLGWAPDDWDALCTALPLSRDVLQDAGLGFVNRRNRMQDAFRARVLFPIFDTQGEPVAIGGRVLPGSDDPAKYKNSSETAIYAKSKVLYGLNWAKAGIVEHDEAIVCEGYTDVIGMATAGLDRAVAPCGTALTEQHVRLLKRFASRVVLAFDADAAGQGAAERFYEWEQTHEIDVAVAALPPGRDPGDLAREDPEALRTAVAEAQPFLGFRVGRVLDGADLSSPEGRARTADRALAVIHEHPNPLVRDQYLMEVADRCRVDADQLRHRTPPPAAVRHRQPESAPGRAGPPPRLPDAIGSRPELEALRLVVHRPEEIGEVTDHFDVALFADPLAAAVFESLADGDPLHEVIESAPPEVGDVIQRLAVEDSDAAAIDVVAGLAWNAAGRALDAMEARARRDSDDLSVIRDTALLQGLREKVQPPEPEPHALDELLTWLTGQSEEQP